MNSQQSIENQQEYYNTSIKNITNNDKNEKNQGYHRRIQSDQILKLPSNTNIEDIKSQKMLNIFLQQKQKQQKQKQEDALAPLILKERSNKITFQPRSQSQLNNGSSLMEQFLNKKMEKNHESPQKKPIVQNDDEYDKLKREKEIKDYNLRSENQIQKANQKMENLIKQQKLKNFQDQQKKQQQNEELNQQEKQKTQLFYRDDKKSAVSMQTFIENQRNKKKIQINQQQSQDQQQLQEKNQQIQEQIQEQNNQQSQMMNRFINQQQEKRNYQKLRKNQSQDSSINSSSVISPLKINRKYQEQQDNSETMKQFMEKQKMQRIKQKQQEEQQNEQESQSPQKYTKPFQIDIKQIENQENSEKMKKFLQNQKEQRLKIKQQQFQQEQQQLQDQESLSPLKNVSQNQIQNQESSEKMNKFLQNQKEQRQKQLNLQKINNNNNQLYYTDQQPYQSQPITSRQNFEDYSLNNQNNISDKMKNILDKQKPLYYTEQQSPVKQTIQSQQSLQYTRTNDRYDLSYFKQNQSMIDNKNAEKRSQSQLIRGQSTMKNVIDHKKQEQKFLNMLLQINASSIDEQIQKYQDNFFQVKFFVIIYQNNSYNKDTIFQQETQYLPLKMARPSYLKVNKEIKIYIALNKLNNDLSMQIGAKLIESQTVTKAKTFLSQIIPLGIQGEIEKIPSKYNQKVLLEGQKEDLTMQENDNYETIKTFGVINYDILNNNHYSRDNDFKNFNDKSQTITFAYENISPYILQKTLQNPKFKLKNKYNYNNTAMQKQMASQDNYQSQFQNASITDKQFINGLKLNNPCVNVECISLTNFDETMGALMVDVGIFTLKGPLKDREGKICEFLTHDIQDGNPDDGVVDINIATDFNVSRGFVEQQHPDDFTEIVVLFLFTLKVKKMKGYKGLREIPFGWYGQKLFGESLISGRFEKCVYHHKNGVIPKPPFKYKKYEISEAVFTFVISSGFKANQENLNIYRQNLLQIKNIGGIQVKLIDISNQFYDDPQFISVELYMLNSSGFIIKDKHKKPIQFLQGKRMQIAHVRDAKKVNLNQIFNISLNFSDILHRDPQQFQNYRLYFVFQVYDNESELKILNGKRQFAWYIHTMFDKDKKPEIGIKNNNIFALPATPYIDQQGLEKVTKIKSEFAFEILYNDSIE